MILLTVGSAVIGYSYFTNLLTWASFLPGFPVAGGLAAAYLWIRPDIWLTTKDMKDKSNLRTLVSRQADCLIAILLLFLVAVGQCFLLNTYAERCIFFGTLLVVLPVGHYVARSLEKFLRKWHK